MFKKDCNSKKQCILCFILLQTLEKIIKGLKRLGVSTYWNQYYIWYIKKYFKILK